MLDPLEVSRGAMALPRTGLASHPMHHHGPSTLQTIRSPRRRTNVVDRPNDMIHSAPDRLDPYRHVPTRPALLRKRSSQRSGRSSNAEGWFDDSNRNVRDGHRPSVPDDEPPFYISDRLGTGSHSTACMARAGLASPRSEALAPDQLPRQGLQLSESSRSDDYRSVIDDLTVENQQLRRRLMMYERLQSSRLGHDKLFEVTFHGLSAEKRRELEHALREFACTVERTSSSVSSSSVSSSSSSSQDAIQQQQRSSESQEGTTGASFGSRPRPADSGYGSNSNAGQTSAAPSSQHAARLGARTERPDDRTHGRAPPARHGREKHDATMLTEHQKKRLVVRRLEQLFTGKMSSPGRSEGHPWQLQEISPSAADADRIERESAGPLASAEGVREARIRPVRRESSDDMDRAHDHRGSRPTSGRPSPPSPPGSPEQRPTRPLDLDPHRLQPAAENFNYIRHLGMSTPTLDRAVNAEPTEGWVYLNLLSNMAQLHTINVTPTFMREAVAELSTKLELSEDGRKIRWKGGHTGTRLSGESGSSSSSSSDLDPGSPSSDEQSRGCDRDRKRNGRFVEDARPSNDEWREGSHGKGDGVDRRSNLDPRFAYRPLFFQAESTGDGTGSRYARSPHKPSGRTATLQRGDSGSSWQWSVDATNESPSDGASVISSSGPLIFYKGARFCTDLSGEETGQVGDGDHHSTKVVLDDDGRDESIGPSPLSGASFSFPIGEEDGDEGEEDEDGDETWTPADEWFVDSSPVSPIEPCDVPTFEVSGLAGVHPADHFLIHVRSRRSVHPRQHHHHHHRHQAPRSSRLHAILRSDSPILPSRPIASIPEEVIHSSVVQLPPSTLPPPSFVVLSSSTSAVGDDDEDDEETSERGTWTSPVIDDGDDKDESDTLSLTSSSAEDEEEEDEEESKVQSSPAQSSYHSRKPAGRPTTNKQQAPTSITRERKRNNNEWKGMKSGRNTRTRRP